MEELNHDILYDIILSNLPVKSLLRFRCVSTAWRNMIDDPSFATRHCSRAYSKEPGQILLIVDGKSNHYSTTLRALREEEGKYLIKTSLIANFPKYNRVKLQNSCNGLLCFFADSIVHGRRGITTNTSRVFVHNPITKETVILPSPPPPTRPSIMLLSHGLGHDPSKNMYKIVRSTYASEYNVEIHTLGTSSWRKLSEKPRILCGKPIFAYGALHWKPSLYLNKGIREGVLVSLDMAKEVFYLTPHPEFQNFHLADLGGYLSIVDLSSSMRIEIWMLKDDDCGNVKNKERVWVKEHIIETPDGKQDNGDVEVVGMWNNGEILLQSDKKYISYNPKKKTGGLRYVNIHGLNGETQVCGYRGSLISLSTFM